MARFTALSVLVTVAIAALAAWGMRAQVEAYVIAETAREAGVPFPHSAAERAALLTPPLAAHVNEMQQFIVASVVGGFAVLYLTLFVVVRGAALQLARQNAALRDMVNRDVLTGIANHRALLARLNGELPRATHARQPLSVVLFDVDQFKLLNDTHGHPAGDRALRLVARALRREARETDTVGRYGGDEFMAILPGADAAGAQEFAGRVLATLSQTHMCAAPEVDFEPAGHESLLDGAGHAGSTGGGAADGGHRCEGEAIPLSASAGGAIYPLDSALPLELIALADRALSDGKRLGGGRVEVVNQTLRDSLALQDSSFGVLDGLVTAVDAKDRYTRTHSEHVASLAARLAEELGLPIATRDTLRTAGLLHDVGKIGIPDRILRKPGRLTDEERRIVQQHVKLSEMIIQGIPRVEDVLDAVIHHHERWDGGGYSRGLAGERIPLLGRILAIADAYSAMTLDRPYRKGLSGAEALAGLERGSGAQFDPSLVAPFVGWARQQAGPLPGVPALPAAVATPLAAAARAAA